MIQPVIPERPGRRFWAAVAGGAVLMLLIAVAAYFIVQPSKDAQAGRVVGFTAPPTTFAKAPLRVVILRGGETGCHAVGGCGDHSYTHLLGFKQGWNVTVVSQGGTGYVAGATLSPAANYSTRVAAIAKDRPQLVIIEGSVSDRIYPATQVQSTATTLYSMLRAAMPAATLVVVGPAWAGPAPPEMVATEHAIGAAASGKVALFVDPIAEGWFASNTSGLMAADHVTPTDAGQARIATMLIKDLARLKLG